jgi:hypothetical protein
MSSLEYRYLFVFACAVVFVCRRVVGSGGKGKGGAAGDKRGNNALSRYRMMMSGQGGRSQV